MSEFFSVPDAFRESLPPWLCENSAGDEDDDVVVSADRVDDVDYGDEDHISDHEVDGHSGKVNDAYSDFEESDAGEGIETVSKFHLSVLRTVPDGDDEHSGDDSLHDGGVQASLEIALAITSVFTPRMRMMTMTMTMMMRMMRMMMMMMTMMMMMMLLMMIHPHQSSLLG